MGKRDDEQEELQVNDTAYPLVVNCTSEDCRWSLSGHSQAYQACCLEQLG